MFNFFYRFLRTISYLKAIQIFYLTTNKFGLKKKFNINTKKASVSIATLKEFKFIEPNKSLFLKNTTFIFLNQKASFKNKIDWNFRDFGKLWLYNLNYLDYINQKEIPLDIRVSIISSFYESYEELLDGREPYPTSLRIVNLIKFIASNKQKTSKNLIDLLKRETYYLDNNLEYHLQANHLLENALALWFSCHLFEDESLIKKTKKLIQNQLDEQILKDGAHYELSPMYHQIILGRLLESIALAIENPREWHSDTLDLMKEKASEMLSWTRNISNDYKHFIRINDSVEGIAPSLNNLCRLATNLDVQEKKISLNDSGYRVFKSHRIFVVFDISEIISKNQPGHSHADTFNFILYCNDKPIVVDPGISTYEQTSFRYNERSSKYHNTVIIDENDNNEVWSSFRVGRRAKVNVDIDNVKSVSATHNGYCHLKTLISRKMSFEKDSLTINDHVQTSKKKEGKFNIHLFPGISFELNKSHLRIQNISFHFKGAHKIDVQNYNYALGFNKRIKAKKLEVYFFNELITTIKYENTFFK